MQRPAISRSTYYYETKENQSEDDVIGAVVEIFEQNRSAYGTRKIKVELHKRGFTVSRRRIGRIIKEQGLVSSYNHGTVVHTRENSLQ